MANLLKLMHLEEGLPNEGVIPAKTIMKKNRRCRKKISSTLIGGGEKALFKNEISAFSVPNKIN